MRQIFTNDPSKVVKLMKVFLTYFPKKSPIYQQAKLLLDLFGHDVARVPPLTHTRG